MKKTTPVKIMEAAIELFRTQGYQGASLNDITRRAKLSKGAFFHYYRDKHMIANDVLKKYAQDHLFEMLETQNMPEGGNIKETLMNWLQAIYTDYAAHDFRGGCLLGNWALELSDTDEAMRGEIAQVFLDFENRLVGMLRPTAQAGKLLMEPRQFARILIAALEGVTLTIKVHKDKNRAAREFQALAELVERMIRD
ncbi:MAG: TetR/AcrR family transcriptional regulator [Alphaproteobacteria bacterium]|nr:TetR/AcrR family transcriptional regulator [Alphaproteobacteria bacterium]